MFAAAILVPARAQDLAQAVRDGDLAAARKILEREPALLEARNTSGWTPLHEACFNARAGVVDFLISRGADINALTTARETTLYWALHSYEDESRKRPIIEKLLTLNPKLALARDDKGTPALALAGRDSDAVLDLLIRNGARPDDKDLNGYTPLHVWTRWWTENRDEYLLAHGATVDARDRRGRTALHLAAIAGRRDKIKLLLKHRAAVNAADSAGRTPFDYARAYGHPGCAEELASAGGRKGGGAAIASSEDLFRRELKAGEAAVWYLDSNGWAVRTRNNLLIFDYSEWGIPPARPSLANGRLSAEELRGRSVSAFLSEPAATDAALLALRSRLPGLTLVAAAAPDSLKTVRLAPRRAWTRGEGLEIFSVPGLGEGTGYLVRADGITVFHAGNLCLRGESGRKAFEEILAEVGKQAGRVDLAFLPIGLTRAVEPAALNGFLRAVEILKPAVAFPSGGSGTHKYLYRMAREQAALRTPAVRVVDADNRGERYLYSRGLVR